MNKTLIVYFSHNKENYVSGSIKYLEVGNTAIVAKKIQALTNGDLVEIVPVNEYPKIYNECTRVAKQELNNNARPPIINQLNNLADYQEIYLGYPNWWSTMPMCVGTFLESNDLTNKIIYPFCSHEGSGFGNSIQGIKILCPKANVKEGLSILGSRVNQSDQEIQQWVQGHR